MRILGLDTASPLTTVAVLDSEHPDRAAVRTHEPVPGARPGHGSELLPLAAEVLAATGLGWADVDRIAVGIGPGSFTGIRVGLATAEGLAISLGRPLAGVGTLAALIAAVRAEPEFQPELVVGVLDARRGEVFAAAGGMAQEALFGPLAARPEALAERLADLPGRPVVVGDGAVRFRDRLEDSGAVIPDDPSPLHRVNAAFICSLGAGIGPTRPGSLRPDYGREPDAIPRRP